MQSVKDKISGHKGSTTSSNIQFTPEEIEHLHDLLTDSYTKLLSGPKKKSNDV